MDTPASKAAAPPVQQPVVFQCNKCLAIVGDSLAWVEADESVGTITLSAMRGVACKDESLQTSKAGKDIGCTFVAVQCQSQNCNATLGKMYKTTSRAFDRIRDYYTLKTEMLRGYELGNYGTQPVTVNSETGVPGPTVEALQERIWLLEKMMLIFNERFERIDPNTAGGGDPAPAAADAPLANTRGVDKDRDREDSRRKQQRVRLT